MLNVRSFQPIRVCSFVQITRNQNKKIIRNPCIFGALCSLYSIIFFHIYYCTSLHSLSFRHESFRIFFLAFRIFFSMLLLKLFNLFHSNSFILKWLQKLVRPTESKEMSLRNYELFYAVNNNIL